MNAIPSKMVWGSCYLVKGNGGVCLPVMDVKADLGGCGVVVSEMTDHPSDVPSYCRVGPTPKTAHPATNGELSQGV
jgi:hypothetical protein